MSGIRIVAGEWRGHRLAVPKGASVRPTSERVREAVFDVLGPVTGHRVLDLFAGSGALGLEALSRGASHATFVEVDAHVAAVLEKNISSVRYGERTRVMRCEYGQALTRLAAAGSSFDLLFVDPPYRILEQVMGVLDPCLPGLLEADGLAVIEGPPGGKVHAAGEVLFSRRYGNTVVTMIAKGTRYR